MSDMNNLAPSDKPVKSETDQTMLANKKNEIQRPKTKFNSRDKELRSKSSSRLKSFPAEEVKKYAPMYSPEPISALIKQQNPQKTGIFYIDSSIRHNNNGYGDAAVIPLLPGQLPQRVQSQNMSSMNQQQIANHQLHHQIHQTNTQSESLLTRRTASPERQTRRPFVPNIFQTTGIHDRSSRNPTTLINQPIITPNSWMQCTLPQVQHESSCHSHPIINQGRNESTTLNIENREKQSVEPRAATAATNHRQMMMQTQPANVRDPLNNEPLNNRYNNCQCVYHSQAHPSFQQTPTQQMYQPLYHHACHQQIIGQPMPNHQQEIHNNPGTCYNCYNQQLHTAQVPGQGIVTPQDMTMNRMRSLQHCNNVPIHPENFGYFVNSQPTWPANDPWVQMTRQNPIHLHQQSPLLWQNAPNNNFNQINTKNSEQYNLPQNHQLEQKSTNEPSIAEVRDREANGKKILQFTPDMIRDQELLISTMRQQGIPDNVMRRQFDALLNEQCKHLTYIAQFRQPEHTTMEIKKRHRPARITIKSNENPEWMTHITPSYLPYGEIERLRAEQKTLKQSCKKDDRSFNEANITGGSAQYQELPKENQTNNQTTIPSQMHFPINPHQMWQQPIANCQPYNVNHQTSCNCCLGYYPYANQQNPSILNNSYHYTDPALNGYEQQQSYYPNSHNVCPYVYPYHSHCEQYKVCSNEHNPISSDPIDKQQIVTTQPAQFYHQNEKNIEPSSLLKMRMYKEVIRPQKCNNGLQDPATVQKALEALQDPQSKQGLEYLLNLTKKRPMIKLNGIQDTNELPENMLVQQSPFMDIVSQKRISANGLENTRNPNNPLPCPRQPSRVSDTVMAEYPRQKQYSQIAYGMPAERENGTISQERDCTAVISHGQDTGSIIYDPRNSPVTHNNLLRQLKDQAAQQHYQQLQQQQYYYNNGQNSAGHNDGQGDDVSVPQLDAPGVTRIDRPGGDNRENQKLDDETMKKMDSMRETKVYETNNCGHMQQAPMIY